MIQKQLFRGQLQKLRSLTPHRHHTPHHSSHIPNRPHTNRSVLIASSSTPAHKLANGDSSVYYNNSPNKLQKSSRRHSYQHITITKSDRNANPHYYQQV